MRTASSDSLILRIGVDVSCNAKVTGSHVHEHDDRVAIDVETRSPGGSCDSSVRVRDLQFRLRARLGLRWLDGACVNGCPTEPGQASIRCALPRPFGFGFLPPGWATAKDAPAAYQSPDGTATIELSHSSSHNPHRVSTSDDLYALGNTVPLETVPGGYAATINLVGKGRGCGDWVLVGNGLTKTTFTTIAEQLFPL